MRPDRDPATDRATPIALEPPPPPAPARTPIPVIDISGTADLRARLGHPIPPGVN